MAELAPPVRVSPFIKACRWGFLVTGIAYGAIRYSQLSKREAKLRIYEAEQREINAPKVYQEKLKKAKEEMIYLAKESGTPIPPDFDKTFKI